jgi:hypothetical protein
MFAGVRDGLGVKIFFILDQLVMKNRKMLPPGTDLAFRQCGLPPRRNKR